MSDDMTQRKPDDKTVIKQDQTTTVSSDSTLVRSDATIVRSDATVMRVQKTADEIKKDEKSVPLDWKPGDKILDTYEIIRLLGEGGMGKVFLALHREWGVELAVKCPKAEMFSDKTAKADFVSEAETWIGLDPHPYTVSCYYVRQLGDMPRLFAEYVDGGSLKDWIRQNKLKTLKVKLDIAIQFAYGLDFAHSKGLVHQDVKPANVMMTSDGTAKVTDFGLAKAAKGEKGAQLMGGGMTPAYASPEQFANKPLTAATDIWSWAVSVLEMFTGAITWANGPDAPKALESLAGKDSKFKIVSAGDAPTGIGAIPPPLAAILRKCFNPDAAKRPQSMSEIASELVKIYESEFKEQYAREEPEVTGLRADGLNNKALSVLDLGRPEEAEKLLEEALRADPHHMEANYNHGLLQWRSGKITDRDLVKRLEEVRTSHTNEWRDEYLLGLVHIERGDREAAIAVLGEALKAAPASAEVRAAIQAANSPENEWGAALRSFDSGGDVKRIAMAPDGGRAYIGSASSFISLELSRGEVSQLLPQGEKAPDLKDLFVTPDGKHLVVARSSAEGGVWEISQGKAVRKAGTIGAGFDTVSVQADGSRFLTLRRDKLGVSEFPSGKTLKEFDINGMTNYKLVFSQDGRYAAVTARKKDDQEWDTDLMIVGMADEKVMWRAGLKKYEMVNSLAFLPGGQRVVSAHRDGTLRIWDVASGTLIKAHPGPVNEFQSVTPDGRFVLAGGEKYTNQPQSQRIWDVETGKCLRTFDLLDGAPALSMAASPGSLYAVSGGAKKFVVWSMPKGAPTPAIWMVCKPKAALEEIQNARSVRALEAKARAQIGEGKNSEAFEALWSARAIPGYERNQSLVELCRTAGNFGQIKGVRGGWNRKIMRGHTSEVYKVALAPDNKRAFSGGSDFKFMVWDIESGAMTAKFNEHEQGVRAVAAGKDSNFAISGDIYGMLLVWDVRAGKPLRKISAHDGEVYCVALSPDNLLAASGGDDRVLRLWDLGTGKCLRTFDGHTDWVYSVAFTPDGQSIISSAGDGAVNVWDISTGECAKTYDVPEKKVKCVCLSPDGARILVGTEENLHLLDAASGAVLRSFEKDKRIVNAVTYTLDGRYALAASGEDVKVWDPTSGECLRILQGHEGTISGLAIGGDGYSFVTSGSDKTVRSWAIDWDFAFPTLKDWDEGARRHVEAFIAWQKGGAWGDAELSEFMKYLAIRGYGWLRPEGVRNAIIRIKKELDEKLAREAAEREENGKKAKSLIAEAKTLLDRGKHSDAYAKAMEARALPGHGRDEAAMAIIEPASRRGTRSSLSGVWKIRTMRFAISYVEDGCIGRGGSFIVGTNDNRLLLWDGKGGDEGRDFAGHGGGAGYGKPGEPAGTITELSRDGKTLATVTEGGAILIWDVSMGGCLKAIESEAKPPTRLRFSHNGRLIAATNASQSALIIDVAAGKVVRKIEAAGEMLSAVDFTPDGRRLLFASSNAPIYMKAGTTQWKVALVYDADSGALIRRVEGHGGGVTGVRACPDGKHMLTASQDNTLRLWDIEKGVMVRALSGHEGSVENFDISSDGRYVASVSGWPEDRFRLWDLSTGKCLGIYRRSGSNIIKFSSDGTRLLVGTSFYVLSAYQVDWSVEFPNEKDWDDGASPVLRAFLARNNMAQPNDAEFKELLDELACYGYGWLNPEGVRAKAQSLIAERLAEVKNEAEQKERAKEKEREEKARKAAEEAETKRKAAEAAAQKERQDAERKAAEEAEAKRKAQAAQEEDAKRKAAEAAAQAAAQAQKKKSGWRLFGK